MSRKWRYLLYVYAAGALAMEVTLILQAYENGGFQRQHGIIGWIVTAALHLAFDALTRSNRISRRRADRSRRRNPPLRAAVRGSSKSARGSNPVFRCGPGLLRGACHRARMRATRWLAMTLRVSSLPAPSDQECGAGATTTLASCCWPTATQHFPGSNWTSPKSENCHISRRDVGRWHR
jgi:hypothetical protein